jgi:hypothetical protein
LGEDGAPAAKAGGGEQGQAQTAADDLTSLSTPSAVGHFALPI